MSNQLKQAKTQIERIEAAMKAIRHQLEQDKNDVLKLGWPAIGSLGHVAELLEETAEFLNTPRHCPASLTIFANKPVNVTAHRATVRASCIAVLARIRHAIHVEDFRQSVVAHCLCLLCPVGQGG